MLQAICPERNELGVTDPAAEAYRPAFKRAPGSKFVGEVKGKP